MSQHAGEIIRKARFALHLSLEDVADAAGLSISGLSARERGKIRIKPEEMKRIAAALKIPIESIADPRKFLSRPVAAVPAGGSRTVWPTDDEQSEETVIEVSGDSMVPTLCHGDKLRCRKINPYEEFLPVEDGDVVAVKFAPESPHGDEYQICRVFLLPENTVHLRKDNPRFKSITVPREHIDAMWKIEERTTRHV